MPSVYAATSAFNLLTTVTDAVSTGPSILGMSKPAHILTPSVTVRGVVNLTALAGVEAAMAAGDQGGNP